MQRSFLPIEKMAEEPFVKILGYPRATKRQISSRIIELKKLDITGISFEGNTRLGSLDVLGKGYVGIVVLVKIKKNKKYSRERGTAALKIRRIDSQRDDLEAEANLLQKANKVNVGPIFYSNTKNFLVMEFLDGPKIGDWIQEIIQEEKEIGKLKKIIRRILEDCYRLDSIGLDHGELSSISKHVIVGKVSPTIIDFESASTKRRVSNVTSATQGIFIGSGIAKKIQKIYKISSKNKIIKALQQYKHESTKESFDILLRTLKL